MIKEKRFTFHGLFIFLLLGIFAVMSTLLVLYSAQVYNKTVTRSEKNNVNRIMRSFVASMARTGDEADTIRTGVCLHDGVQIYYVERLDYTGETDAAGNDLVYARRLYCDEGILWESYAPVTEEQIGAPVEYEELTGAKREKLCDAIAFVVELNEDGLLEASLADIDGVYRVKIALRTARDPFEGGDVQ
ncbi:MAG: hypothetical protein CW338_01245 [Clostridiales bacterium]|nr:hypothetical protein [Clostridiales bacterium]